MVSTNAESYHHENKNCQTLYGRHRDFLFRKCISCSFATNEEEMIRALVERLARNVTS
jgi:hypothetical protein